MVRTATQRIMGAASVTLWRWARAGGHGRYHHFGRDHFRALSCEVVPATLLTIVAAITAEAFQTSDAFAAEFAYQSQARHSALRKFWLAVIWCGTAWSNFKITPNFHPESTSANQFRINCASRSREAGFEQNVLFCLHCRASY